MNCSKPRKNLMEREKKKRIPESFGERHWNSSRSPEIIWGLSVFCAARTHTALRSALCFSVRGRFVCIESKHFHATHKLTHTHTEKKNTLRSRDGRPIGFGVLIRPTRTTIKNRCSDRTGPRSASFAPPLIKLFPLPVRKSSYVFRHSYTLGQPIFHLSFKMPYRWKEMRPPSVHPVRVISCFYCTALLR